MGLRPVGVNAFEFHSVNLVHLVIPSFPSTQGKNENRMTEFFKL